MNLIEKVKDVVERCVPKEGKVGVAVSGGSDSSCLLDVLIRHDILPKERILVINFEHGLRGQQSKDDSAFVERVCKEYGVEFYGKTLDVKARAKEKGESIETSARIMRREEFARLLEETVSVIMLAHNADDQTETVLMHIFRGCGVEGLVGMREKDGKTVRPLISCRKSEISDYVKSNNVAYVQDSTNADSTYTRNFVRNEVLPLVRSRYAGVDDALARLSQSASETIKAVPLGFYTEGSSVVVTLGTSDSIKAAFKCAGLVCDYSSENINEVTALFGKNCGVGINLPHGYRAEKESGGVRIYKDFVTPQFEMPFKVGNFQTECGILEIKPCINPDKYITTVVDPDKIPSDAVIRTRREGDRFVAVGSRDKLLSDYLTGKKIPRFIKRKLLYLASGKDVLAIVGIATGEKVKIDANTKVAVEITKI